MIFPSGLALTNTLMAALIVAGLFLAREIFVLIVLAILLTFVLTPLVSLLERARFPRSLAVISAVAVALAIISALGTMVMTQATQLARDLPQYQTTLRDKVHNLRDVVGGSGLFKNASSLVKSLSNELDAPERAGASASPSSAQSPPAEKPLAVEIHQPDPAASETLVAILKPLISPITTTGIVTIFVIFFLFQREDLRNRFIRLVGTNDLERTTTALDDAGGRLTRLFLTQLILNAAFGAVIGIGLALIGVPSAPLWGLLAMVLRFVPYIGAMLAALLPLTLAAAVGPDWTMALWTAALFLIVEPLTGQVIEPLVYGHSSGLSPVAIVVSATFWTWLWGPIGLLLSTPLTVCLVVLARHVERLQFIDILLGDQPALTPQQMTYQRMLAGDPIELIEHAQAFLKSNSLFDYYDKIVLRALQLAQVDAERGRLDDARLANILKTVAEIVEDVGEQRDATAKHAVPTEEPFLSSQERTGNVVMLSRSFPHQSVACIAGLGSLDAAASLIVADLLKHEGVKARASAVNAVPAEPASLTCICFLENVSEARARYAKRRAARAFPDGQIIVALLGNTHSTNARASLQDLDAATTVRSLGGVIAKIAGAAENRH